MDTKVEQFLQEQFHQFSQIDVRELVFSSELHKYCERNACGKYNTNWMCPPGIGDLKPLITKYLSFAKGYLFNLVITLSDVFNYGDGTGRKIAEAKLKTLQKQLKSYLAIFGAGGCPLPKLHLSSFDVSKTRQLPLPWKRWESCLSIGLQGRA